MTALFLRTQESQQAPQNASENSNTERDNASAAASTRASQKLANYPESLLKLDQVSALKLCSNARISPIFGLFFFFF